MQAKLIVEFRARFPEWDFGFAAVVSSEMSPLYSPLWSPSVPQPCSRAAFSTGRTVSARVSIRGRRWETDDYIDRGLVPRADGRADREVISIFGASVPGSMIGVALMRAVWTVAAPGHWYYLLPWSAPTSKITADERESKNEGGGRRGKETLHSRNPVDVGVDIFCV